MTMRSAFAARRDMLGRKAAMVLTQGIGPVQQLITAAIAARYGGPEMVGRFVMALAIITPLQSLFTMGLRQLLISDMGESGHVSRYVVVRLATGAGLVAASSLIGFMISIPLGLCCLALSMTRAVELLIQLTYGQLQKEDREADIVRSAAVKAVIAVVGLWIGFMLFGDLAAALAVVLLCTAVSAVLNDLPGVGIRKLSHLPWPNWRQVAPVMAAGAPLAIAAALNGLAAASPRFFLQGHGGEAELGVFGACLFFAMAGSVVSLGLGQAQSASMARAWWTGDLKGLGRMLALSMALTGALGIGMLLVALLLGRPILALAFGPEFWGGAPLLLIVVLGAAMSYQANILNFAAMAGRAYGGLLAANIVATAAVLTAGWILTSPSPLMGAALTYLVYGFVFMVSNGAVLLIRWRRTSAL